MSLGGNVDEREPTTRIVGEDIPSALVGAAILVILLGIAGFWVLARSIQLRLREPGIKAVLDDCDLRPGQRDEALLAGIESAPPRDA